MKKLNFKAVPTRDIEGNLEPRDISKELGNFIYRETSDLGELDLAAVKLRKECNLLEMSVG